MLCGLWPTGEEQRALLERLAAGHPLLVVLAHDGDNYGGGTDSYYHSNFQNFVDWLAANPSRFQCTTVEDYLQMFPPDSSDVIHVENGAWSGADNGDPEFSKWNADPDATGYSSDRNSWAVMVAARNRVHCLILRGVTDLVSPAGGEAYGDYALFEQRTAGVMQRLLASLSRWLDRARS